MKNDPGESQLTFNERGWLGHVANSSECFFRRNTLLTLGDVRIVVSSAGWKIQEIDGTFAFSRQYETRVFYAKHYGGRFNRYDADPEREICFVSPWYNSKERAGENSSHNRSVNGFRLASCVPAIDADDIANSHHDAIAMHFAQLMELLELGSIKDIEDALHAKND